MFDMINVGLCSDNEKTVTCDDDLDRPKKRQSRGLELQKQGELSSAPLLVPDVVALAAVAAATVTAGFLLEPSDAAAAATANVELVIAQASLVAPSLDVGAVFLKAGKASLGGGASGAAAAVVQVITLMWLRTAMNFQASR